MILSRRQVHFYSFVGLGIILPIVFIAGLALRPNYDMQATDAATDLFAQAGFATGEDGEAISSDSFTVARVPIAAETLRLTDGSVVLDLTPKKSLPVVDVLVYWDAGSEAPEALGDEAVLLGNLAGDARRRFEIPAELQGQSGQLVFYSQAQSQVVTAAPFAAEMTQ
ncbi:MAG: hypothetical protein O2890_09195 [Cyanobacteria bacterium]|nr:hypothetical protein [Cyanobacteriota bacterium]MDA0866581.1 hypothetical protein [Cyanobacteriota bacterium]